MNFIAPFCRVMVLSFPLSAGLNAPICTDVLPPMSMVDESGRSTRASDCFAVMANASSGSTNCPAISLVVEPMR